MIKHGLLICSFQLKKKYSVGENDLYKLNKSLENGGVRFNNIFDIMKSFVNNYKTYRDDENTMKMFAIDERSLYIEEGELFTTLSCTVMAGAYGIASEMTNKDTLKVVYTRKKEDADIKPFQMMMYVPHDIKDKTVVKGILMFETVGSYGVKTITVQNMQQYFSEVCGLTLITRNVSVKLFVEKLLTGDKISRITLVSNKVSIDPSDNMFINSGREEKIYVAPTFKMGWINKLLCFIGGGDDKDNILEINDITYDDIKLTFMHGGRTKTVSILNLDSFSLIEDVPGSIYPNGDVDREALRNYMKSVALEYSEKMVFVIE